MSWSLPDGVLPHVVDSAAFDALMDARTRLYDQEWELLGNAFKSLIMLGWATDELIRCSWPGGKQTIRITVPREFAMDPNGDVFEVITAWPVFDPEKWLGGDIKHEITVTGRWLDWPMRY